VCDHDHLSLLLCFFNHWYKQAHDRFVIQILFRLIQNNRNLIFVDQKIEDQKERTSLSR
jgi:hypothetical protein